MPGCVERLFSQRTQKRLRRGVSACVDELVAAISACLGQRDLNPRPLAWTASVQTISEKLHRGNKA